MNKNKGFNIIEVAMSIMVISIAILMIIAIYTNIIQAQAKGIGKTVASAVAEKVIQNIINSHPTTNKESTGKNFVNEKLYYYYYKIYPITDSPSGDNKLLKIDISVYWDLADNKTETDLKNLSSQTDLKNSVKFSRLVMISSNDY